MRSVAVYLDTSNLYYCVKETYNKKIDYTKLIDFLGQLGDLKIKKAFSAQFGKQAAGFLARLQKLGFETFCKEPKSYNTRHGLKHKADWDVGIAVEVMNDICNWDGVPDCVILCTADSDFEPLVKYIQPMGIKVLIVACNISHELKSAADEFIEMPEMLLL